MPGSKVVRAALFACGYWTDKLKELNGNYLNLYSRWLNASLPRNSGYRLVMDAYEAQKEEYPEEALIDEYDVIIVSGSPEDAWSSVGWVTKLVDFIRHVSVNYPEVRIFGACFGHQIISRSLGGEVITNPNKWEAGPTVLKTTAMGKLLYGVDRIRLQEFHLGVVPIESLGSQLASGEIYLLAHSDLTPNQGIVKFYDFGRQSEDPDFKMVEYVHILTCQGHPEFDEPTVTELIRQLHEEDSINDTAYVGYFGPHGTPTDAEPISKPVGSGRRWDVDYDGILVIGKTFWEMFGVDYSEDERIVGKPKRHGKHAGKVIDEMKKPNAKYLLRVAT